MDAGHAIIRNRNVDLEPRRLECRRKWMKSDAYQN
jgi:hypothetical protein